MASKRGKKGRRRERREVPTASHRDSEGNVLVLRCELSPATIEKIREGATTEAAGVDDVWQRREEMLFERLAVSWEIAGLPLDDQKMLLGRYRMADPETRRWVRETITNHVRDHIPELGL